MTTQKTTAFSRNSKWFKSLCFLAACFDLPVIVNGFVAPCRPTTNLRCRHASFPRQEVMVLENRRLNQEIDENSRRKAASSSGTGSTVAGAVLGGLLLGPFGALFGASVGSSVGAQNAVNRARQEEMKRLGLTPEMLESAEQVGLALEQCNQGLAQVRESLDTQQRLARRLDADVEKLYEKAKKCINNNQEEEARKFLLERERVRDRLKEVLGNCVTAKNQVAKMEENAAGLERRAMEIESLLQRTVGASAMQNSQDLGLALDNSDPLLQKFKDMGID